jgi:ribonucleoside-diphosphate reductase alpha chain
MDCDTTGIEPDIALVKYKVLAGGGMLKIVNKSVPLALKTLGYTEPQIESIASYIDKNDMIEGAPELLEEHLPIFDCAFRPAKGKRSIHYKGHIKMMSAVQPFLSGAISKTINMPEGATVDEIMQAYIYAWEQGLKAVAIYRENSKRSQPLNTQKTEGEMVKKKENLASADKFGERIKLPQTRRSVTHKFDIAGHEGYITIGLYDNGAPGELFVTMSKVGSTIGGLVDSWATSVSINLQYGVPVDLLFNKFRHQKFEPSGFVRNIAGGDLDKNKPIIRTASSIVDYVAQFMQNNFGSGAAKMDFSPVISQISAEQKTEEQKSITDFGNEGLVCPHCGGPAKRMGNCAIFCTSCKQTTRSGCGE